MAIHEITIHENAGGLSEVATYTASYLHRDTIHTDDFIGFITRESGLPGSQALAIFEGSIDCFDALEKTGLVRIHTDIGTIAATIVGSFPTADAEFDPKVNELRLSLYLDDSIRLALVNEVPTIISDVNLTKLRVDNLANLDEQRPYNLIHGQKRFRVSGYNMVMDDVGAEIYLENAQGAKAQVEIDHAVSKQLLEGHTKDLLDGGDYKLVIKSRAGDPEGPLQTVSKRVKYLKAPSPEIVVDETLVTLDAANHKLEGEINGSNLKLVEGDSVWYDVEVGGQGFHGPATVTESTDEQIKFEVSDEDISAEWAGQPFGGKLKARGGNPYDPQQEITLEGEIEG